ncbi:hypothetical protein M0804_001269 [Polistes exclamans]|nr:hypothetical protein M0804_001269 [Polistes exclamans]
MAVLNLPYPFTTTLSGSHGSNCKQRTNPPITFCTLNLPTEHLDNTLRRPYGSFARPRVLLPSVVIPTT